MAPAGSPIAGRQGLTWRLVRGGPGENKTLGQEPKSMLGRGNWSRFLPVAEGPEGEHPSEEPSHIH